MSWRRRLFANWRYDRQDHELPDFVLNRAPFRQAKFLIAGANFGCGSSRDTAPKMLSAFGIRCVVAPSFGGIFHDNCFKIGVLPMVLDNQTVETLAQEAQQGKSFSLDVAAQTLADPAGNMWRFDLPSFRREQLLTGADDISLTLRRNNDIIAYQERERAAHPWAFLPPGESDRADFVIAYSIGDESGSFSRFESPRPVMEPVPPTMLRVLRCLEPNFRSGAFSETIKNGVADR